MDLSFFEISGQFLGEFSLYSLSIEVENGFGGFLSRTEALLELLLRAGSPLEVSGQDVEPATFEDEENGGDGRAELATIWKDRWKS